MRCCIVFAVAVVAAPLAAQAPRALQVIDLFRLDYFMQYPFEEPRGWIDADHYLVFDGARPDAPKAWSAVTAATGAREALLPRPALATGLHAAGLDAEAVAGELDDPEHYHWSPDHTRVLINAGNDLFVSGRDGAATRLTSDAAIEVDEQFAPDGQHVAFVRDHDLYVVPTAGGEAIAITHGGNEDLFFGRLDWVYQEEVYGRGHWQGFWWSPDSRHLALLKLDEAPVRDFPIVASMPFEPKVEDTKYPVAGADNPVVWLGVADVGGGEVRWFDTSKYPDQDRLIVGVTWAPDGKEVLFQVQNREQTWLDMLAGDVQGKVRQVFHEGSDCWVEPGFEPHWVGCDTFLWLSERDGCRHVYRYGRDGKEQGRLTGGDWQVDKIVAVDEAGGRLFFTADKESPLTKHLYSVPLAGGDITAITQGRGTHDIDMAPGCGSFLSTFSSTEMPHEITLRDATGKPVRQVATSRTGLLQPFRLSQPEFLQIATRDGFEMQAMLIKPRDFDPKKRYPVLQCNYSGPHTPRVRDEWQGRDYLWNAMLAQHGFVVFACDNRSASGRGRKYAKACWRDLGSSELKDLEDGVHWLIEQGIADPKRIGIWGWSYGGYQTCFNLTHSTTWQCGIAVNAVTDWRNYDTIYTERYLGLPTTNAAGYERSSVVQAAGQLHGKLMLIAAALDDNVHLQNSLQLLKALQEQQKDCDFMIYPGVRHGIEDLQQQLHLFARMLRFLQANL